MKTLFKRVCFLAVVSAFVIGFNASAFLTTISGLPEMQCDKIALIFSQPMAQAQSTSCFTCSVCVNNLSGLESQSLQCTKDCLNAMNTIVPNKLPGYNYDWQAKIIADQACHKGCITMIEKAKKLCGYN